MNRQCRGVGERRIVPNIVGGGEPHLAHPEGSQTPEQSVLFVRRLALYPPSLMNGQSGAALVNVCGLVGGPLFDDGLPVSAHALGPKWIHEPTYPPTARCKATNSRPSVMRFTLPSVTPSSEARKQMAPMRASTRRPGG